MEVREGLPAESKFLSLDHYIHTIASRERLILLLRRVSYHGRAGRTGLCTSRGAEGLSESLVGGGGDFVRGALFIIGSNHEASKQPPVSLPDAYIKDVYFQ